VTRAISERKAVVMAAACEFIARFFLGTAVAKVIGKDITVAWFITIPASGALAGLSFFLIRSIRHI
jgi:phosphate/sulfate permease